MYSQTMSDHIRRNQTRNITPEATDFEIGLPILKSYNDHINVCCFGKLG